MKSIAADDVFTPGAYPQYTFIQIEDDFGQTLQSRIESDLKMRGILISISGPSKSGKTVLVQNVIEKDKLIIIPGGGIRTIEDFWQYVSATLGIPDSIQIANVEGQNNTTTSRIHGDANVVFAKFGSTIDSTRGKSTNNSLIKTHKSMGIDALENLASSGGKILLIDDFHYIPKDVQSVLSRILKEVIRREIKVICTSVSYRSDDVVRANPDFSGRLQIIDLDYWKQENLEKIAIEGFDVLNLNINREVIKSIARESAGSPQLMQMICARICQSIGVTQGLTHQSLFVISSEQLERVYRSTAKAIHHAQFVKKLLEGPKVRGKERRSYFLKNGKQGDVYYIVLTALSQPPTQLSFRYSEITSRVQNVCQSDYPTGSATMRALEMMYEIAIEADKKEVFDWNEEDSGLEILDPYFIFFLRWSENIL